MRCVPQLRLRGQRVKVPALAVLAAVAAVGCASGDGEDEGPGASGEYRMQTPALESIAPTEIALGDAVKVFGSGFVPKEHGTMSLYLDGAYTDSDGDTHPFEGEVVLNVENESVANFDFQQIFFHPTRDKIGTWRGTAMLVNRAPSGDDVQALDELWSNDQEVALLVKPSVMATRLRSADASGCAPVTGATNGEHNIEVGFRAIGLGEASEHNPWTVRFSFISPEVNVYFVSPDLFEESTSDIWPLRNIEGNVTLATKSEDGNNRLEWVMTSGDQVVLNPQTTPRTVRINPPVSIGQQIFDEVYLGKLATGPVEFAGKNAANFLVEIVTADGRSLRRVLTIDVWNEFEIGTWSGSEFLAERYQAHATSGCITCSPNGPLCSVEYSEGESQSRSRSLAVRWDSSVSTQLGFNAGFSAGDLNVFQINASTNVSATWSSTFSLDVTESVSSEEHKNRSTGVQVIPSYAAMSYRQLERRVRSVDVVYHNECGASGVVGQAELTNWNFGFEVATGPECAPPTNLPPPEKND